MRRLSVLLLVLGVAGCTVEPNPSPFENGDPTQIADAVGGGNDIALPPQNDVAAGAEDAFEPVPDLGADAGAEDVTPDTDEPDVGPPPPMVFPENPLTEELKTTGCNQDFVVSPIPWDARPSSERVCKVGTESVPCLPWEFCDAGVVNCEAAQPKITGTRRCLRRCEGGSMCPAGGACQSVEIDDCDVVFDELACKGKDLGVAWPKYPQTGAQPAEGGLSCWTGLGDTPGQNSGSRVAVVGGRVYLLTFNLGTNVDTGAIEISRKLQWTTLAGGEWKTVLDEPVSEVLWTRILPVGDKLLVIQRPAPKSLPENETDVYTSQVLLGTPAEDGSVEFATTDVELELPGDNGAPVPGTSCIARRDANDIRLFCFKEVAGKLEVNSVFLGVPPAVDEYLGYYEVSLSGEALNTRTWSMAASNKWIVVLTGNACGAGPARKLHFASFGSGQVGGDWVTVPLTDPLFPSCQTASVVLAYQDTVYVDGLTARLKNGGPTPWMASTQPARGDGHPIDWTIYGDAIVQFNLLQLNGADPPGRLYGNRFLW